MDLCTLDTCLMGAVAAHGSGDREMLLLEIYSLEKGRISTCNNCAHLSPAQSGVAGDAAHSDLYRKIIVSMNNS